MMKNMTLDRIAAACGGTYVGSEADKDKTIDGVAIDSRKVEANHLFVAIRGEKTDGHRFVPDVLKNGAACALVENAPEDGITPYILVSSTTKALRDLAAYYLPGLDVKVVGITGSVGKTSTKETIAAVLSEKYKVLKTEGNFNNEIGLPLTVFRIREEHEVAVLEMGISEFGEMERLSAIARPDIGVITNIGICHLENLGTRDGILKAKTEMFHHLKPGAAVVLNADDDKLSQITEVNGESPMFFSMEPNQRSTSDTKAGDGVNNAAAYATDIQNLGLRGMQATFHISGDTFTARMKTPGLHTIANGLAACCVAHVLGMTSEEIKRGLEKASTIQGRTHLIETNNLLIIDDCYNANPVSMREALDILTTATGRKIAVLGDMGELGTEERKLHYEVGEHLAKLQVDALFCAGTLSAQYVQALVDHKTRMEHYHFTDADALRKELCSYVKKGDTVLVKASHFMNFSRIVEQLQDVT